MTQPDEMTMAHMASTASQRAGLWCQVGELVGPITDQLLAKATDGKLARQLEAATEWVGETNPFSGVLPSRRDVFEHGRVVDPDEERASLRRDLEAVYDESLAAKFAQGAQSCNDEADHWDMGDDEQAKAARLAQYLWLKDELEALADWCVRLYRGSETEPARMLAGIVAAHLSLESGVNVLGLLPEE